MKSLRNNTPLTTKKIIVSLLVAIVIIILVTTGMFLAHVGPFQVKTSNDKNIPAQTTNSSSNKTSSPSTNSGKTPVNNQPTDNQTPDNTVGASITYIQQADSSLEIGINIEDVTSTGTCTLTLTKDNKTVTHSVGIQALASTSTCKGFTVPIVELSAGLWDIKIDIKLESKEAHLSDSFTVS